MASGYSYNGFPANSDPSAIGVVPFHPVGVTGFRNGGFPTGVKGGDVATVFERLVERLHREVEPMDTDPISGQLGYGCWSYEYRANVNNPAQLSCHASGTAIDYNAPRHRNGTSTAGGNSGWSPAEIGKVRAILADLGGVVRWLESNDPMHFEIHATAAEVAAVAARIRAGQFDERPADPTPNPAPVPAPTPAPATDGDDDMPKVIAVIADGKVGGYALVGPTGTVVLSNEHYDELGACNAVLGTDQANQLQIDVYNGVLRRGVLATQAPQAAPAPPAAPAAAKTYTVVAGDTLSGIGAKLGIDWRRIAQWNGLKEPYEITPGQVLKVSA